MAKKKVFSISSSLTGGLEETFAAAKNYSGELHYDIIPLRKIELDPENPRDLSLTIEEVETAAQSHFVNLNEIKKNELQSLHSLSHSIKNQGLLNPVIVYQHKDKYRLVAGERRTLASILAGKEDIQVKILDVKPSSLKIRMLQWVENIERSDLSLWERISNLEKIAVEYSQLHGVAIANITIKELADLIGCEKSQSTKYKALLMADAFTKQLIRTNQIKNLDKAALIASCTDEDIRTRVTEACLQGQSFNKLKALSDDKLNKLTVVQTRVKPGRERKRVDFGVTKNIRVGRLIIESILINPQLANITSSIKAKDLDSFQALSDAFKVIVEKLERLEKISA